MAVAVMRRLSSSYVPAPESMSQFAKGLHDQWGLGSRDENNGILLALAVEDRQVYISTGRGAKDQLPDDMIDLVIGNMKPFLKKADYNAAVEKAVSDVAQILESGHIESDSSSADLAKWLIFTGIGGFILYNIFNNRRQDNNYRKCKSQLESLDRYETRTHAAKKSAPSITPSAENPASYNLSFDPTLLCLCTLHPSF
eukprot:925847-Pyramimonas_sp.AAC.1